MIAAKSDNISQKQSLAATAFIRLGFTPQNQNYLQVYNRYLKSGVISDIINDLENQFHKYE